MNYSSDIFPKQIKVHMSTSALIVFKSFFVRKLFISYKLVEIGTYNMILENILFLMKWVSVRSW
jgi:hypothetical protein